MTAIGCRCIVIVSDAVIMLITTSRITSRILGTNHFKAGSETTAAPLAISQSARSIWIEPQSTSSSRKVSRLHRIQGFFHPEEGLYPTNQIGRTANQVEQDRSVFQLVGLGISQIPLWAVNALS